MAIDKKRHEDCYMSEKCEKYDVCPMALVQKLLSGKRKIGCNTENAYSTAKKFGRR